RLEKLFFVYTNHNGEDHVMFDSFPDAPGNEPSPAVSKSALCTA
ncbi:hypothetical protein F441_16357, partial [Phytophthora nicotianae CJ01A1]